MIIGIDYCYFLTVLNIYLSKDIDVGIGNWIDIHIGIGIPVIIDIAICIGTHRMMYIIDYVLVLIELLQKSRSKHNCVNKHSRLKLIY